MSDLLEKAHLQKTLLQKERPPESGQVIPQSRPEDKEATMKHLPAQSATTIRERADRRIYTEAFKTRVSDALTKHMFPNSKYTNKALAREIRHDPKTIALWRERQTSPSAEAIGLLAALFGREFLCDIYGADLIDGEAA